MLQMNQYIIGEKIGTLLGQNQDKWYIYWQDQTNINLKNFCHGYIENLPSKTFFQIFYQLLKQYWQLNLKKQNNHL
jgi:hypothetical protein